MTRPGLVLAVVVMMVALTSAMSMPQGRLKYSDRELVAELAAQIVRVTGGPWSVLAAAPQKRNSELINSLLGLPKVMNDAGRR
ncbi:pigment-dispersing hormone type 1-like [Penaeus chinensis]|uniref:pigment-dispersing hormone type 1-like n=1 Tax=Penaeus chinensis TaxID=139456 RepID=UPI001FB79B44|nr:pigment-dispersing hormone type 1-like [Penaeus chinensis]